MMMIMGLNEVRFVNYFTMYFYFLKVNKHFKRIYINYRCYV